MEEKARPPTFKCSDCSRNIHTHHNPDGSCNNPYLRHASENGKEVKAYCDCRLPIRKKETP